MGLPNSFIRIRARFLLFVSCTTPLMPARGPSNILTLSPALIGIGLIFISPVSLYTHDLIAWMTESGTTASSVPKRTMLSTPIVERTGARFWCDAMAFKNR